MALALEKKASCRSKYKVGCQDLKIGGISDVYQRIPSFSFGGLIDCKTSRPAFATVVQYILINERE